MSGECDTCGKWGCVENNHKYTEEQIREAGKRGELCSIDIEYLITLLKEGAQNEHMPTNEDKQND